MARPSDPLLAWLRKHLDRKGWNTARVAEEAGLDRARVRKVLAGHEPMLVDELLAISRSLELTPADMAGVDLPEPVPGAEAVQLHVADEGLDDTLPRVDPWGNQPEQLVRVAFLLGCDFLVAFDTTQLDGSGVPEATLVSYRGKSKDLAIKFDAAFHKYNQPRYDPLGLTVQLSFDAVYTCRFPWTAFRQVIFFPVASEPTDEPEELPTPGVPHLRLVT